MRRQKKKAWLKYMRKVHMYFGLLGKGVTVRELLIFIGYQRY